MAKKKEVKTIEEKELKPIEEKKIFEQVIINFSTKSFKLTFDGKNVDVKEV